MWGLLLFIQLLGNAQVPPPATSCPTDLTQNYRCPLDSNGQQAIFAMEACEPTAAWVQEHLPDEADFLPQLYSRYKGILFLESFAVTQVDVSQLIIIDALKANFPFWRNPYELLGLQSANNKAEIAFGLEGFDCATCLAMFQVVEGETYCFFFTKDFLGRGEAPVVHSGVLIAGGFTPSLGNRQSGGGGPPNVSNNAAPVKSADPKAAGDANVKGSNSEANQNNRLIVNEAASSGSKNRASIGCGLIREPSSSTEASGQK